MTPWGTTTGPHNKALHQTRRGGVLASRAVVEARLAGEGRCSTGRRGLKSSCGIVLVAIAALFTSACDGCSFDELSSLAAPDGAFTAVELSGSCGGATIPCSTRVVLRRRVPAGQDPSETKVVDMTGDCNLRVMMEWTGPRVLKVIVPGTARNVWRRKTADDVTVVVAP